MPATPRSQGYTEAAVGATLGLGTEVRVWTLAIPAGSGSGNYDFTTPQNPSSIEILDVVLKKGSAGGLGDSHQLLQGASAITDAMDTSGAANEVVRPSTIDRTRTKISGGSTLRVAVVDGGIGDTDCEIDVHFTFDP